MRLLQAAVLSASARIDSDRRRRVRRRELVDYSGEEVFLAILLELPRRVRARRRPVAAGLVTAVPDLTTITRRYGEFPAARIRETIDGRGVISEHGTRVMPVWGYEFWIEEGGDVVAQREMREVINRLVDHIRSLQDDVTGSPD